MCWPQLDPTGSSSKSLASHGHPADLYPAHFRQCLMLFFAYFNKQSEMDFSPALPWPVIASWMWFLKIHKRLLGTTFPRKLLSGDRAMIYLTSDKLAGPSLLRSPFWCLKCFPCLCLYVEVIVFNKYIRFLQLNSTNALMCKKGIAPGVVQIQRQSLCLTNLWPGEGSWRRAGRWASCC